VIKPCTTGKPTAPESVRTHVDLLRPGDIRCGHLYATEANKGRLLWPSWPVFLIGRDPRDNIVSEVCYLLDIHLDQALHDRFRLLPDM